jgi:hypothetical protein
MANEVVARSERLGDVGLPVQVLEDLGGAPVAAGEGRCGHAFLVDLRGVVRHLDLFRGGGRGDTYFEPLLSAAVTALEVARALVHPYHDWTLLMGPLLPVCADLASGCYFGGEVG